MLPLRRLVVALFVFAGLMFAPFSVRAAQGYDNCAGFIDSLPATIATQGVWCLRHDLATGIASGNAINIITNNVTIDCNDFKVGGLAAGDGTSTNGIHALNRLNVTVRRCNIRGFLRGVYLEGSGGGHVVEDDRFDNNTYVGVWVEGDGSVLRRNQVNATGGSTFQTGEAYGIRTSYSVDVLDNTVSGVLPSANSGGFAGAMGIVAFNNLNGSISGNRVHGLVSQGVGAAKYGIWTSGSAVAGGISLVGNHVIAEGGSGSVGLLCAGSNSRAKGNIINGFVTDIMNCGDDGNSVGAP